MQLTPRPHLTTLQCCGMLKNPHTIFKKGGRLPQILWSNLFLPVNLGIHLLERFMVYKSTNAETAISQEDLAKCWNMEMHNLETWMKTSLILMRIMLMHQGIFVWLLDVLNFMKLLCFPMHLPVYPTLFLSFRMGKLVSTL